MRNSARLDRGRAVENEGLKSQSFIFIGNVKILLFTFHRLGKGKERCALLALHLGDQSFLGEGIQQNRSLLSGGQPQSIGNISGAHRLTASEQVKHLRLDVVVLLLVLGGLRRGLLVQRSNHLGQLRLDIIHRPFSLYFHLVGNEIQGIQSNAEGNLLSQLIHNINPFLVWWVFLPFDVFIIPPKR